MINKKDSKKIKKKVEENYILIGAVVVMVAFLLIGFKTGKISGFATQTKTGSTNLTISTNLSITLLDSNIDLGNCTPSGSISIFSNDSNGDDADCTDQSFPDFMEVANNGNVDVEINVSSDKSSDTLIGGTGPNFNYTFVNGSNSGCDGTLRTTYTEFDTADANKPGCSNLSSTLGADNSINFSASARIPFDAGQAGGEATITFTATAL